MKPSAHHGVILLDKPAGVTSFHTLSNIKTYLHTKKIGHAGTLDKFATGLLIVLCGKFTKLNHYFSTAAKEYTAGIILGQETDTLDPEGMITAEGDIPSFDEIKNVLPGFLGPIQQTPPVFSAVHVNGERSYRLARAGKSPELKAKAVYIHNIIPVHYEPPHLTLRVVCSSGTYIRALARDIAGECGTYAMVDTLRRTKIGEMNVEDALSPDWFLNSHDSKSPFIPLHMLPSYHSDVKIVSVLPSFKSKISNGTPLEKEMFTPTPENDGIYIAADAHDNPVCAFIRNNDNLSYIFAGESTSDD